MNVSQVLSSVAGLSTCPSEQDLVDDVVEVAALVCGADHVTATLLGPDGAPAASARRGPSDRVPGHFTQALAPDLRSAVLAGRSVHDLGARRTPPFTGGVGPELAAGVVLAVPIVLGGRVLGGLWMVRAAPGDPFDPDQRAWAEAIAGLVARTADRLRQDGGAEHVLGELLSADFDTAAAPWSENREQEGGAPTTVSHPHPFGGRDFVHADAAGRADRPGVSWTVRRLTAKARTIVGTQAMILSRIVGDRQTFLVIDAEPGIVPAGEGLEVALEHTYCGLLLSGELPPVVPDVRANPLTAQHPMTGPLRMGAYVGAPVVLPDGTVFGTLAGIDYRPAAALSSARLQALQTMAQLIGLHLHKEEQQQRQRAAHRTSFAVFVDGDVRSTVLQPIVDLASGRVSGFEALSRFARTGAGGLRRPDEVFARAARLGMTHDLELAAAQSALELLDRTPTETYLSVNISPRTLMHPAAWDLFTAYELSRVVVELTEHEQVEDYAVLAGVIDGLRGRGARLAIDDLGSGFAGLQHLARLQPDVVKLDISFVRDVDSDPTRAAVARAVGGFAAEVGAVLVAEGIETYRELHRLQQLGASHGQGYLLGRPGAIADALAVHARRPSHARLPSVVA